MEQGAEGLACFSEYMFMWVAGAYAGINMLHSQILDVGGVYMRSLWFVIYVSYTLGALLCNFY